MEYALIRADELGSDRMRTLCEALAHNPNNPAHKGRVLEAYTKFMCHWAQSLETDAGLFWWATPAGLGAWAGWHNPEQFGRALIEAGYVAPMKEKYPPSVLRSRDGIVYWGAIDETWTRYHRQRASDELCLFLTDKVQRSRYALRKRGLDWAQFGDWLYTPAELSRILGQRGGGAGAEPRPAIVGPTGQDAEGRGGAGGDPGPAAARGGGSGPRPPPRESPTLPPTLSPRPPPPPREEHVKTGNLTEREHVKNVKSRRTGVPPSMRQFEELRAALREDDLMRALAALDTSKYAKHVAALACEHCWSHVRDTIRHIVDDLPAYRSVKWPPALVHAAIRERLALLGVRIDYAREHEHEREHQTRARGTEGAEGGGTTYSGSFEREESGEDLEAIRAAIRNMPGYRSAPTPCPAGQNAQEGAQEARMGHSHAAMSMSR